MADITPRTLPATRRRLGSPCVGRLKSDTTQRCDPSGTLKVDKMVAMCRIKDHSLLPTGNSAPEGFSSAETDPPTIAYETDRSGDGFKTIGGEGHIGLDRW